MQIDVNAVFGAINACGSGGISATQLRITARRMHHGDQRISRSQSATVCRHFVNTRKEHTRRSRSPSLISRITHQLTAKQLQYL